MGVAGRFLLILSTFALAVVPVTAQVGSREEELARVRRQIKKLQQDLQAVERRESGAEGRLERLDVELELQNERLLEARAARALSEQQVADSERRIADLEVRLAAVRDELRGRLGGLYRLGGHGYLRLFLSVEPGTDMLEAIRLLRFLVRRDARAFRSFRQARDGLEDERKTLIGKQQEVRQWLEQEEDRQDELARMRRRQETLLAELGGRRRSLEARASELEDRESKLANFLDFLYGRSGAVLSGRPIQDFRGVLDRPVAGRVSQGFGPRLDPRYRTRVPHNGVAFTTASGDEVRSVYPGKVLFAAPFRGYGPTVIVHHAGRVFTLYAGLSSVGVGRDEVVSLGDVVGRASNSLYFEIRVENRPEDPLQWFR
ncbi:MAG: peptidoglycan DD-metalloendopeptidase family protein [Acidobacteriota bacterium]